jgi:nucleoside-diphosphate-sugar epimerase
MIHVDDLADAYVHAIESDFSGEIFNVTDNSALSVTEMVRAAFRATGNKESFRLVPLEEAAKTMGGFAECLALDQHVDSTKAHRMLGWKPKHADFATDAETHYMAWKQYKK